MAGDANAEAAAKAAAAEEKGFDDSTPTLVKQLVRDVGSVQFPMLTPSNYGEWAVIMKVMLKARGLWAAVTTGVADEQQDLLAMEAILKAVSPKLVTPLGAALQAVRDSWGGQFAEPLHLVLLAVYTAVFAGIAARTFRWE